MVVVVGSLAGGADRWRALAGQGLWCCFVGSLAGVVRSGGQGLWLVGSRWSALAGRLVVVLLCAIPDRWRLSLVWC